MILFCFKKMSIMWRLHVESRENSEDYTEIIQEKDYLNFHQNGRSNWSVRLCVCVCVYIFEENMYWILR